MRAIAILTLLPALSCGRVGFGSRAHDALVDAAGDVDSPIDVMLGQPCTADVECGRCARCDQTCKPELVKELYLGHRSTCFTGLDGTRWCTGENNDGQLGLGDTSNRTIPTRSVDGMVWDRINLFYYGEALAVSNGQFFEWGNGTLQPSPRGVSHDVKATLGDLRRKCFWELDGTSTCDGSGTTVWHSLDYGAGHFCGVREIDRTLWCWGTSYSNAIGVNVDDGTVFADPVQVGVATDWEQVGVGGKDAGSTGLVGVSCAMKTTGDIYCFGETALAGTNGVPTGAAPRLIPNGPWSWLDVDWQHACAGKPDGSVWCWGNDTYGGYVVPNQSSVALPTKLQGIYSKWIMGGHHACGLTSGLWRCMGWNEQGQLGDGTTTGTGDFVDFCPAP